ncbi:F-box domain-containing protein [Mycena sanguinolenta]|uniref:F-box domain-containing protein n=1 Tax=Mycena sanguinolenta TaxID=230812 RepID=A0A8H7CNP9_9AGAR|nr:F-box domain-containing protein [Mycena sanguinolenta]
MTFTEGKLNLLTLPNELLLVVFSHLQNPYPLYQLSTLCRRLHFLALPIYLSRTGVCQYNSESAESCDISISAENTDTLAALQTSLFLRTVQNLCCTFSNPQQFQDLARFRSVCSILSSIETTILQFSPPSYDDYFEASYCNAVVQVLNAVVEKSCRDLTVDVVPDDSIARMARMSRKRALASNHPRGLRDYMTTGVSSIPLSPVAFRQKTLSTFRLHSQLLFSPHCRAWTIDVLNSFPLTFVSFNVPTVPTDALEALFMVTEIPTLRDLAVLDCRIKPAQLHLFLSRHPRITRLHLGSVFVPSLEERLPPDHLPNLRELSAPAAQVAYLLQAMQRTAALRSVRVLSYLTRLDLIFTDVSLRTVTSRLASVSLTLVFNVPSNLPRFVVDLDVQFHEDSALRFVTALEFVFEADNVEFSKLSDYVSLTKWCEPFPALKTVTLSGFTSNYSTSFVLEAFGAHSFVETLLVNGVAYDLRGAPGRSGGRWAPHMGVVGPCLTDWDPSIQP